MDAIATIAGASGYQVSQTAAQVAVAVAVKVLDTQRQMGAAALELVAAALTGVGRNLDVRA